MPDDFQASETRFIEGSSVAIMFLDDSSLPERIFAVISWVFLLRASAKCADLRRAKDESFANIFVPVDGSVVGIKGEKLMIRLVFRKNMLCGDTIVRPCVCKGATDVSVHIPVFLCPVHVLWPVIAGRARPGERLFKENIGSSAAAWLKVGLQARLIPNWDRYGLHSLRRGAAQSLIEQGGGLSVLLRAGSWRSSAFRVYLDNARVEDDVSSKSVRAFIDHDLD